MELGRFEARAEKADELLSKIEKIKPELIRNSKAEYHTKYYPSCIVEEKEDLRDARFGGWPLYVLWPLEQACFRCEEAMRRGEIPDNYSEF